MQRKGANKRGQGEFRGEMEKGMYKNKVCIKFHNEVHHLVCTLKKQFKIFPISIKIEEI